MNSQAQETAQTVSHLGILLYILLATITVTASLYVLLKPQKEHTKQLTQKIEMLESGFTRQNETLKNLEIKFSEQKALLAVIETEIQHLKSKNSLTITDSLEHNSSLTTLTKIISKQEIEISQFHERQHICSKLAASLKK